MPYTRVNWADGSGGGTPVSAANLNNMDAYIATLDTTAAKLAGAAFTGAVTFSGKSALLSDGSVPMTGQLSVTAPPLLLTGQQETGALGIRFRSNNAGAIEGNYVNFKTVLTNTPSSVTLTRGDSSNDSATGTFDLSVYGFGFNVTANLGSTATWWNGRYTTVGNCIIALDPDAGTFDHHCDAKMPGGAECGYIRRGLSVDTDMLIDYDPDMAGVYDLHTRACPQCGGIEHFYTSFGSVDEAVRMLMPNFDDRAEVLAAQPYLIRCVQQLLGLTMKA